MNKIRKAHIYTKMLSIYRPVLNDSVMQRLTALLDYICSENYDLLKGLDLYNAFFYELVSRQPLRTLHEYMADLVLYTDTPFSSYMEMSGKMNQEDKIVWAAGFELGYLQEIAVLTGQDFKTHFNQHYDAEEFRILIKNLPVWDFSTKNSSENILMKSPDWSSCIQKLIGFYNTNGSGIFARHKAFIWEVDGGKGYAKPVLFPDTVRLSDLIGYERERSIIIENTRYLLNGNKANNILLYGDRGTGKSSTVKAILNEYAGDGLRLIEVKKDRISFIPDIIQLIRNSRLKFILFVDDLSFEDSGNDYTSLKAALEGGIENIPDNMVIYATSNRRHLVRESFSDRGGPGTPDGSDEVRIQDTMQEKLSLSDRFGITVVFSSPDKKSYLDIVKGLAERYNIEMPEDILFGEAMKWELWYNSRSPRTAHQFINYLRAKKQA